MAKAKNRKRIILVIIIGGAIAVIFNVLSLHPLFRSPRRLSNDALRLTPIGMHIDDVAALVESQMVIKNVTEWSPPIIDYERGYVNPTHGEVPGWSSTPTTYGSAVVGYQSVRVSYKTHYNTYISIYWGFDDDGRLIDVLVEKTFDMINGGQVRRTADD